MSGGEDSPRVSPIMAARRLERAGDPVQALALLRGHLRANAFSDEELPSAGRLAGRLLRAASGQQHARVLVLAQCTANWLADAVAAVALGRDLPCVADSGPYDNVLQALDALDPAAAPDFLVLLPWHQRLLNGQGGNSEARIAGELAYWQQAWQLAAQRGVRRIIQLGYDWTAPDATGFHLDSGEGGTIDTVRHMNRVLRAALPADSYFVPLEEISGMAGRRTFYDRRREHWTRQPFSESGVRLLSEHIVAGMRALGTGPRKVLVLDLDNTLWGGVVGETGALGIELGDTPQGEAFRAFQRYVLQLKQRGVLLAVCSKNNDADAREPFLRNPDMVLALDDFAHFVACWEPKSDVIGRIARELRLGLDSFVFFDDNPFERALVRETLPEVEVVEVPADPSGYIDALRDGLWFEASALTAEDLARADTYAAEAGRRAAAGAASSVEEYLGSLDMRGDVQPIGPDSMARVVQLLGKTNQFNLSTRRHTAADVKQLLAQPRSIGITLRVVDRFADHGLVALAIGVADQRAPDVLCIDSFLMSCRVIGRTVELFLMQRLLELAQAQGYNRVRADYIPSAKNQLVVPFLTQAGFSETATGGPLELELELELPLPHGPLATFVRGAR